MNNNFFKQKLKNLPDEPGVYLMKNAQDEVIYVGKAKSLKNRVGSYFISPNQKDLKTKVLVKEILDFDIVLTNNEGEAILLERNLIRVHHPIYNVLLKDGKEYPFIRVNFKEKWPRIEKVRKRKEDGAFYLGPFSNAGQLAIALKLMWRIFPLTKCSRSELEGRKRPCNYYHIKMCLGPCTLPVNREEYISMVKNAISFLMGKNQEVRKEIKQRMEEAAGKEEFERAAHYRDQLFALEEVAERQSVVVQSVEDADVFGVHLLNQVSSIHVLIVRNSKIIGSENFLLDAPLQTEMETLEDFILQYYESRMLPGELIFPFDIVGIENILNALSQEELTGQKVNAKVSVPKRGPRFDLIEMATRNAKYNLELMDRQEKSTKVELEILKETLGLADIPHRMECIDISNLQGEAIVASNVCFVDGKPSKTEYRSYIIKESTGQDDFGAIEEVVKRRINRGLKEENLPDLLIIDGGKGQLASALKATMEFPELKLSIVSLAKARNGDDRVVVPEQSMERVFLPGKASPIILEPGSPAFRLLTHIRDEAHRFAITHHRKRRAKIFQSSELEEISGIGPSLRRKLLETFKGIEGIKNASLEELLGVKGLKETTAVALYSKFHRS